MLKTNNEKVSNLLEFSDRGLRLRRDIRFETPDEKTRIPIETFRKVIRNVNFCFEMSLCRHGC